MTITYIATLLAALSATASAGCFTTGATWADAGLARYHANRACFGYDGQAGAFQGFFRPGEEKRACVNTPNNQRYDFIIKNENGAQGFDLADSDCRDRLYNEINGCSRGGRSTVAGWTFTSDPNDGRCG